MFIRNGFLAAAAAAMLFGGTPSGAEEKKQPVLVMLYSRFEDHINTGVGEDWLFRLLALVGKLRKDYPAYPATVNLQFSGAYAQTLVQTQTAKGYLRQVQSMAKSGAVTIGYSGEHEPTYRNRPKAGLKPGMTPEERWTAQTNAAECFLSHFKDPLTGDTDGSRGGGLRAVRETIGDPSAIHGFAPQLGGEAPYFHQLRRMGVKTVAGAFTDPYFTMNIHGYRVAATEFGKAMFPVPGASSEVFWDGDFLRASFTDSADLRRISADEGMKPVKELLEKLDRSRVRLVHVEMASYSRYLDKWPDGTPKLFPLIWAYDHPEDPELPNGIKAFLASAPVLKGYEAEEELLRWLFGEFLPQNPGSRLVTPQDLMRMAATPVGSDVSATALAEAVRNWTERTAKQVNRAATYAQAGNSFYTAADLFQLLANSLAGMMPGWRKPDTVKLTAVQGPIVLYDAEETFPNAKVAAREVARVAAQLAPRLIDQTWKPVPGNAIPARIEIAGKRLIPAQFLALMAEAYLAPSPDTPIPIRYFQPLTAPGYMFPRQNALAEAGHVWTLRPAPLNLSAAK
jgi:hypothetical protein